MRVHERRTREGNFLILFGFSSAVLMGMGALSIDIGYLRDCQMQLQNGVDAAAHAALISYREYGSESQARTTAKEIAEKNFVGGKTLSLADSDIVFGTWDFDDRTFTTGGSFTNSVQVSSTRAEGSLDGPINFFLGPVIGVDSGSTAANATGAYRFREMELLLDTTGSFFRDIDNGRNAVLSFLDKIYENHLPQDKIGLLAFAQNPQEFTPLQDVVANYSTIRASWYGQGDVTYNCRTTSGRTSCSYYTRDYGLNICLLDRDGDWVGDATNTSGLASVACQKQTWFDAAHTIHNINCYSGSAYNPAYEGTNHATALTTAVEKLTADGINGNMKVIVMVSDGRAQCLPLDNASSQACVTQRQADARTAAAAAAAANISIFSVMFCSNCSSSSLASYQAYADSLVTGIGKSYTTTDSGQLDDILNSIADSLPVSLVQ